MFSLSVQGTPEVIARMHVITDIVIRGITINRCHVLVALYWAYY